MYSTANERGYISTAFLFALRQNAGGTPAIRRSRLHFRIAGISPVFLQIRRRDGCDLSQFFVSKKLSLMSFLSLKKNCQYVFC
ncbi:MAG: hypothetical protein LBP59_02075 [Planctomycetaceae bacterium]|nr:hypothetical protein [Planctomycetaceae bacterium]